MAEVSSSQSIRRASNEWRVKRSSATSKSSHGWAEIPEPSSARFSTCTVLASSQTRSEVRDIVSRMLEGGYRVRQVTQVIENTLNSTRSDLSHLEFEPRNSYVRATRFYVTRKDDVTG